MKMPDGSEMGSLDENMKPTEIGEFLAGMLRDPGDVAGASAANYAPLNGKIMLMVVADKEANFGTLLDEIQRQLSNLAGRVVHIQGHMHEEGYVDPEDDGFGPGPETIQ